MATTVKRAAGFFVPLLLVALIVACASTGAGHAYKLYPGPPRTPVELATLRFGDGVTSLQVDGMRVNSADYERVELLPGKHDITWDATFAVSVLVNPAGRDEAEAAVTTEFLAGHEYSVHGDRTTGPGYRMYLWIEDTATGRVVGGSRKP